MNKRILLTATLLAGAISGAAFAADHRVSQKGRAFDQKSLSVGVNDTVQFSNDDEFIHQIYVTAPEMNFDSAESEPGNTIPVKFPAKGDFQVRCHIHPKMLLNVHVE